MFGAVGRRIRIQEEQLDLADIHVPDLGVRLSVRQIDGDDRISYGLGRLGVEIVVFERFLLPAGGLEALPEMPLPLEKAETQVRKAQIAGGF